MDDKNLVGAIIGGSHAFGFNDEYSDLEIGFFWELIPDQNYRKKMYQSWGIADSLEVNALSDDPFGFSDHLWLKGLKIDVIHMSWSRVQEIIRSLVSGNRVDSASLALAANILYGKPLFLSHAFKALQKTLKPYPKRLRDNIVKRYSPNLRLHDFSKCCLRKEFPYASAELYLYTLACAHVVCARKGRYFPGNKWLMHSLKALDKKSYNHVRSLWNEFHNLVSNPKIETRAGVNGPRN